MSAAADLLSRSAHWLHSDAEFWPETNCYVDLWIELLHDRGLEPAAALAFTAALDFEGDAFTFFKFSPADLALLFDADVQELGIFDRLDRQLATQIGRGRSVLVEVDAAFLPDVAAGAGGTGLSKTTIAVDRIDIAARSARYFHNAGRFELAGADYEGALRPASLAPYVEFVKWGSAPLSGDALRKASRGLLDGHLRRLPVANPVAAYRRRLPADLAELHDRPPEFFHLYAFHNVRQLGANFELLARYVDWLSGAAGAAAAAACQAIAGEAKLLQFRLARLAARRRFDPCDSSFDILEAAYEQAIGGLSRLP